MKFKSTSLEKKWIWYDVGNSAFTMLIATLLPIFFHEIAQKEELRRQTTCLTGLTPPVW